MRLNIISNLLGQGSIALLAIAFLPTYIKHLGIESYGLIGLYSVLQVWLSFFDFGMTPTLMREMARYSANAHTAQTINDLLRSIEILCFTIASAIGLSIWLASDWLASHWLEVRTIQTSSVAHVISFMALIVAIRFCEGIYRGALIGLQKILWFNLVNSTLAIARFGGSAFVVAYVSPTLEAFFAWQAAVSLATVATFAIETHRSIPKPPRCASFSRKALNDVRRFAGGASVTALMALLLTQVDKTLLSHLLPLEAFGHYMLAVTVAGILPLLGASISTVYFARFTAQETAGNAGELSSSYHHASQLAAILVIPAASLCTLFPHALIVAWTGNSILAAAVAPILQIIAFGNGVNGLLNVPFAMQLANGWSSLAARLNTVAVIILLPAIVYIAPRFGAIGAAWLWVFLMTAIGFVGTHLMHRRLLASEKWAWIIKDVAIPSITVVATGGIMKFLEPIDISRTSLVGWLGLSLIFMVCAAAASMAKARAGIAKCYRDLLSLRKTK